MRNLATSSPSTSPRRHAPSVGHSAAGGNAGQRCGFGKFSANSGANRSGIGSEIPLASAVAQRLSMAQPLPPWPGFSEASEWVSKRLVRPIVGQREVKPP
jgi:hypothetical protein